jgi:hypothetical protein
MCPPVGRISIVLTRCGAIHGLTLGILQTVTKQIHHYPPECAWLCDKVPPGRTRANIDDDVHFRLWELDGPLVGQLLVRSRHSALIDRNILSLNGGDILEDLASRNAFNNLFGDAILTISLQSTLHLEGTLTRLDQHPHKC